MTKNDYIKENGCFVWVLIGLIAFASCTKEVICWHCTYGDKAEHFVPLNPCQPEPIESIKDGNGNEIPVNCVKL